MPHKVFCRNITPHQYPAIALLQFISFLLLVEVFAAVLLDSLAGIQRHDDVVSRTIDQLKYFNDSDLVCSQTELGLVSNHTLCTEISVATGYEPRSRAHLTQFLLVRALSQIHDDVELSILFLLLWINAI